MSAPKPLRAIDASMILGLPDSPENQEWLREALDALQNADPRPDVDLGGIEGRLAALEGRPLASPPVDLSDVWAALGALGTRVSSLEDENTRLRAELAAALARQVLTPAPVLNLDPLDPMNWRDVPTAQAALMVLVTEEAARRCGQSVALYNEMVALDALGGLRSADEDLRLMQHQSWAKERVAVELARLTHNGRIAGLESVETAVRYNWREGWPEL